MLTAHERQIEGARKGGLTLQARLRNDPVFARQHKEIVSRRMKKYWATKRAANGTAAPVPVKANSSNGNGRTAGRHSGLSKALDALDAELRHKQEEVKLIEAKRRLLETAQALVKATIQ